LVSLLILLPLFGCTQNPSATVVQELRRDVIALQLAAEPIPKKENWFVLRETEYNSRLEQLMISVRTHEPALPLSLRSNLTYLCSQAADFGARYHRTVHSDSRPAWDDLTLRQKALAQTFTNALRALLPR
jgi:hypothetical protein